MDLNQKFELQETARKEIVDTLELISSKKKLLDYQKEIPKADVTEEMFSDWDSAYIRDQQWFIEKFNERELQAIDMFNSRIEKIWYEINSHLLPINEFVETSQWREIASAANETLSTLNTIN